MIYMKKLLVFAVLSCILFSCEKEDTGLPVTIDGLNYCLFHGNMAIIDSNKTWEGELNIPETIEDKGESYTVKGIMVFSFNGCTGLTKVRIPETIDRIIFHALNGMNGAVSSDETNLFGGCTALESIEVDKANSILSSVDGVLFNKDRTHLYSYPAGAKQENYTIPEGTTSIGNSAFAFCESLQILDIPKSVQHIGSSAFMCTHLKAIIIRGTFPKGLHKESFEGVDAATIIYVQQSEIEKFKKVYSGTVLPLESFQD